MSNSESTPLVPTAKPLYLDVKGKPAIEPPEHRDSHVQTKWHNPTEKVVRLALFVGTPQPGKPPRNYEEKTGNQVYVWQPGETKALGHEFDNGIQQTECMEIECLQNKFGCTEPTHEKVIVGGLGPQLINLGLQTRPKLHPALDDEIARLAEAERKEFEAYKRRQAADIEAARARAEAEVAQRDLDARARADAEAAAAAAKHQPKSK